MFKRLKEIWKDPRVREARAEFQQYTRSIRASFTKELFEASPDFWSYHVAGIVFMIGLDFAFNTLLAPSYLWGFQVMASAIWAAGFFVSGFALRSHYTRAHWETQSHTTVLFKSIASSVFFSFFIVMAMSFATLSVYFDDLYRYSQNQNPGISSARVSIEFFFRNWFSTSFSLLCWLMLYIGITSRRKTKQMEVDNLRLQNSLKEAELSSLANQLNPHFLFNALNNIRFMIHEDANNAEKMLMSLSSVLRYSLDSSKNVSVALKDELEISRRYIDLIQIQFEERLKFVIDIPDHLLTCQLPPMVLQMLLENAVKHGIDNIREGGTINVHAKFEGQVMVIEVSNDLPKDYAHKVMTKSGLKQDEPGIGLFNINQRLNLLYSGKGSIKTKIENNRFYVTVNIPQEQRQ